MGYLTTSCTNSTERVQNAAARLICKVSRFDPITPSLYFLHWLPIIYGIKFEILLVVFKALNGLAPLYENFCSKSQPLDKISNLASVDTSDPGNEVEVLLSWATAHLLVQHPNCGTISPAISVMPEI